MKPAYITVVPVDADVEAARLALSSTADRYRDNDAVLDALANAFDALARVNSVIDCSRKDR